MKDGELLLRHPHFILALVLVLVLLLFILIQIPLVLSLSSCYSPTAGAAARGGRQRPWAREGKHSKPRHDERLCSELVQLPLMLMLGPVLLFFLPLHLLLLQLLALALRGLGCCYMYCSRYCFRYCFRCCWASRCCSDAWSATLIGDNVQNCHDNSDAVTTFLPSTPPLSFFRSCPSSSYPLFFPPSLHLIFCTSFLLLSWWEGHRLLRHGRAEGR